MCLSLSVWFLPVWTSFDWDDFYQTEEVTPTIRPAPGSTQHFSDCKVVLASNKVRRRGECLPECNGSAPSLDMFV